MSFNFNADEIFEIGVQIETNGQKFYEMVAKNTSDPSAQNSFWIFPSGNLNTSGYLKT